MCIKRGPFIDYKKYPETVSKVIQILKDDASGDVDIIVEKTGFKRRTMYNWRKALKTNPRFNPLCVQFRQKSRIFTDEEEDSIAQYIWSEKIIKSFCFTDEDGIEILTNAYLEKHYLDEDFDFEYNVSNGYIYEYKKRHNFVSKLCHLKRRPTTDSTNYDFIDMFIDEMKLLFDTCANERIVNVAMFLYLFNSMKNSELLSYARSLPMASNFRYSLSPKEKRSRFLIRKSVMLIITYDLIQIMDGLILRYFTSF